MSDEGYHYPPEKTYRITGAQLAKMRQCLYDAKFLLSQSRVPDGTRKLIEALDQTILWQEE